ncbi:MAG: hypothetical protein AAFO83_00160 [Cyanobacteria bacterium J06607_13]
MKFTLRIDGKTQPEAARRLIALAKHRSRPGLEIELDITMEQQAASGLLEDSTLWDAPALPSSSTPKICRAIAALEAIATQDAVTAANGLKELVGLRNQPIA